MTSTFLVDPVCAALLCADREDSSANQEARSDRYGSYNLPGVIDMNRNLFPLLAVISLLLTSCTMASKYVRPASPVSRQLADWRGLRETKTSPCVPALPELVWQEFFTDGRLQKMIEMALNTTEI